MRDKRFYLLHVEELCRDMERNIQLAWDVFVQKVYTDTLFVRRKNLSIFPENEEIHRDLVSNAIAKVVEDKTKLLEGRKSCSSLISNTITKISNLAIDYFRKYIKEIPPKDTDKLVPYNELSELIEKILSTKATPFQTKVYNLSITGYKNPEIAKILDISESSVSSALYDVKKILRELLKDYRK